MPSNELETIAASIQDALHRAYAMGRSDALRRVVEMVQADELGSKTVTLLGHSAPPAIEASHPEAEHIEAQPVETQPAEAPPIHLPHGEAEATAAPSDAVHVGHAAPADNAGRSDPPQQPERIMARSGSMGEFLRDYFYPIKTKK